MDQLDIFISEYQYSQKNEVSEDNLAVVCELLEESSDELLIKTKADVLQILSYYALDGDEKSTLCINTIDKFLSRYSSEADELINQLCYNLRPLLLRTKNKESGTANIGLKPKLGFSFKEDELLKEWKEKGGIRSIPLFYVVLRFLKRKDVSANVWWITPGILNLLDNISDLKDIKLQGLVLLRTLLEFTFNGDEETAENWISFAETGLFKLYEPILVNMSFFLPPAYNPEDTLMVYLKMFPTLDLLYKKQHKKDYLAYQLSLRKFLSEIILQSILPRISYTYEQLTLFILNITIDIIGKLGDSSVVHLQRLIYTVGEYLVKNPFFTTSAKIMDTTIELLLTMVQLQPEERLRAHKYDFLALIVIIYEKNDTEGAMTASRLEALHDLLNQLSAKNCTFDEQEKTRLGQERNLVKLFI